MVAADMTSISSFDSFRKGGQRTTTTGTPPKAGGGVKSFMHGIVSPFTACFAPTIDSTCGPSTCMAPEYQSCKPWKPSVVSPMMDRFNRSCAHPKSPKSPEETPTYQSPSSHPPAPKSPEELRSQDIDKPREHDVLCGRGGSSNRHLGNMHFRELVAANKKMYVGLTKKQKMMVARQIVEAVHSTNGRFLAKDLDTCRWYDIGVPRSLEKTSQALREKNSNDYQDDQSKQASDTLSDASGYASPRSDSGVSSPLSLEDTPTRKNTKSSKNVDIPTLIIPPHLAEVFGPKKSDESQVSEWPDYGYSSQIEQPYLNPYPSHGPPSPSRDYYHVPPRASGYYEHANSPARSPVRPSSHYDYGRSPHYPHGEPSYYSQSDRREHYDYYSYRRPEYRDHGYPTYNPSPASSSHFPPRPPSGHYRSYPPPPPPPRQVHPNQPGHRYHHRPLPPPQTPPPVSARQAPSTSGYDYPQPHGTPRTPPRSNAVPSDSSPPPLIYRSVSGNGYVRAKGEVSPDRRQEYKRQKSEVGARRLSESSAGGSLSRAVEHSLSLEERVVGREREASREATATSKPGELTSPAAVLQSRSRSREKGGLAPLEESKLAPRSTTAITPDRSELAKLSGLAALSTAAFLKLDEE